MVPDPDMTQETISDSDVQAEVGVTTSVAEGFPSSSHPMTENFPSVPYKGFNPYAEADAEIFLDDPGIRSAL
ncbi:hypothetical protein [Leptodesmis sp.]|uniref:hypothetical protein n=1 Tax=Leptodesmis sp. TaxID=3100501 RepID=UPI0040535843